MTRRLSVLCAALSLLGLAATPRAHAAAPRVRIGAAAALAPGVVAGAPVPPGRRLRVTVGMTSRDPLGLSAFAQAVATPGAAQYGHFLSVHGFARRFGAPRAALHRIRRALRAGGLTVLDTAPDGLAVTASGPAARIERAFATRLRWARAPHGARTIIDTAAPSLPPAIASGVAVVLGLDGLAAPRSDLFISRRRPAVAAAGRTPVSASDRSRAGARPRAASSPAASSPAASAPAASAPAACAAARAAAAPRSGTIPAFGYPAGTLDAAYGVPALAARGDLGQGETVAVYEQQSLDPRDIATFQACYGTHAAVSIRHVDTPDPVDAGIGGDGEAALDVEQIIGVAPRARVIVYAASQSDANGNAALLTAIASQDVARVVSISDSVCEAELDRATVAFEAKLFEEMAAQGQSVFASTGDQGAETCSAPNGTRTGLLAVGDPASQPTVTAVGGTSLYSGAPASARPWPGTGPLTEGVWNSGPFRQNGVLVGQASTGGLSRLWAMPRFQSAAPASLGVRGAFTATGSCGAPACREVPDVSADADPSTGTIVYSDGGTNGSGGSSWAVAGGTSVSAPLWAGLAALTDALPGCEGFRVGDLNPALYRLAASGEGRFFRDVQAPSAFSALRSNDASGAHPGIYPVGRGYDLTTGLGAPRISRLAPALCGLRVTPPRFGAASLRAIARGRLGLRFTVTRPHGPRLRSITVRLPPAGGLTFGPMTPGLRVTRLSGRARRPVGFTLHRRRAAVTVRLRGSQDAVRVELDPGTLRTSRTLAQRPGARVRVVLGATDSRGLMVRRALRLRVPPAR